MIHVGACGILYDSNGNFPTLSCNERFHLTFDILYEHQDPRCQSRAKHFPTTT